MHPILRTRRPDAKDSILIPAKSSTSKTGEAESEDVIEELTNYMVQPGAEYRHKWRKGDIVIWDNRCSYRIAAADILRKGTAYTGAYRYTTITHHTVRLDYARASRPVYACLTPISIRSEPCTASTQFKSWGRRCPSMCSREPVAAQGLY